MRTYVLFTKPTHVYALYLTVQVLSLRHVSAITSPSSGSVTHQVIQNMLKYGIITIVICICIISDARNNVCVMSDALKPSKTVYA